MGNLVIICKEDTYRSPKDKIPKEDKTLPDTRFPNKQEVLTLLRDPSPDGDNLDAEIPLSDEESKKATKASKERIPVRINGVLYRRFFGKAK